MHILLVHHTSFPHYIHGGVDACLFALIPELERNGHRVSVLIPGKWSDDRWQVAQHGPTTLYTRHLRDPLDRHRPVRGFLGWLADFPGLFLELFRLVRREKVDVIHLHTLQSHHYLFRLLRLLGGPPYLITFHGTDLRKFRERTDVRTGLLRWILRGAASLTVVNQDMREIALQCFPELESVEVVPNGIAWELPQESPVPEVISPFLRDRPARYCVQVSDLEPVKGVDVTLRAWARVNQADPDLHLVIIGRTDYYPDFTGEMMALIQQSGVSGRVHLTGKLGRREIFALAQGSLGWLMPSRSEGLPYVLLEAGLMHLPVICSDISAFRAVVTHGVHAWLTGCEDPDSLADGVLRVVGDGELSARLGQELHQLVTRHYSAQVMARTYAGIYARLVTPPARGEA